MKVRGAGRRFVRGLQRLGPAILMGAAVLAASCSGNSPTAPPPIVEPPPPPPPPPPIIPSIGVTRILTFGDSMTAGTTSLPITPFGLLGPGLATSYPFKLQGLLSARYTAQTVTVFNAGEAGNRAVNDRDRFADVLSETQPEIVFLLEGANDLNQPFVGTETVDQRITTTVGNLEDMVRRAVARGLPVYIGTLPPQRPGGKGKLVEYVGEFNEEVREMAGKKGARVIEFSQLPLSLIGVDGLHPTEAGYERMAEMVMDVIRSTYEVIPGGLP
jgi:lysophospholipase L1-like esterase